MGTFKILKPGLLTIVEDAGRYGYQQFGVPVSGVMDSFSHRLANILVGNDEKEAVLEVTMLGPYIEFLEETVIAITGGNLTPVLNGKNLEMNRSALIHKGDKLKFQAPKSGCRSYIAFAGGIDVPDVMGSKSTYARGNIGGFEGRGLKEGDILKTGKPKEHLNVLKGRGIQQDIYKYTKDIEVRIVLGPQNDCFTDEGIKTFLSNRYTVTNECDRMGYRLEGEAIEHVNGGDIISDGIAMGAIQVPSHGRPIIMMADRQTTGGYTKIANVITVDLPKIAQSKPGDTISFKEVTINEAHDLLKQMESAIQQYKDKCKPWEVVKTREFHIKVKEKSFVVKVEELKEV